MLACFYGQEKRYILYTERGKEGVPILCAGSRETARILKETLWSRDVPAILTSGTLKAGNGFGRMKQASGLAGIGRVREYEAKSPFQYERNCLLYLPETLEKAKRGSRKEAELLAGHIKKLVCSTYGHTLVLFTSYSLMGSVCQILRSEIGFPMVEVWRHAQEEIARFKGMGNAVLFAAGSCWEGMDFPGDMVSSLIIVKLPFAVPDPVSEAEREQYGLVLCQEKVQVKSGKISSFFVSFN